MLQHQESTNKIVTGFRPLDGESISKLDKYQSINDTLELMCFRPLDGESISKR